MDQASQEHLNKILTIDPSNLTQDEVDFLRARRSYLKAIQLEEYESVLKINQTSKAETVKTTNAKLK